MHPLTHRTLCTLLAAHDRHAHVSFVSAAGLSSTYIVSHARNDTHPLMSCHVLVMPILRSSSSTHGLVGAPMSSLTALCTSHIHIAYESRLSVLGCESLSIFSNPSRQMWQGYSLVKAHIHALDTSRSSSLGAAG